MLSPAVHLNPLQAHSFCPIWCSYPLPDLFAEESDEEEHPAADKRFPSAGSGTPGSSAAGLAGLQGQHFAGGGMQAALAGAAAEAVHGVAGELAPGAGMGARAPNGSGGVGPRLAGSGSSLLKMAASQQQEEAGVVGGEMGDEEGMDRDDSMEITRHTKREVRR